MAKKASLLIADDEKKMVHFLRKEFERAGHPVHAAHDGKSVLEVLNQEHIDVLLLDIYFPDDNGLDILKKVREEHPHIQVIMLTGNSTVETALQAMKLGAYDYLSKPYNFDELRLIIDKAYGEALVRRENEVLRSTLSRSAQAAVFVGETPEVKALLEMTDKVAASGSPILLCGETGTGKEILAQLCHDKSPRKDGSFLALNCSAFQDTLLESELFGHERGAFTDAFRKKEGLVELAHDGSLFLDEIGDMSLNIQSKLLRFLDSGEFRRLGGTRNLRADVRILSATNRDLPAAIADGDFREDLYYRLNVVRLDTPPLRRRTADIPLLVDYFLRRRKASGRKGARRFSREAISFLKKYSWPGNVRELENIVDRVMILADGDTVELKEVAGCLSLAGAGEKPRDASLAEAERIHILRVLADAEGNKTKAAKILEVDVKTLYNKLKKYGVDLSEQDYSAS